MFSSTFAYFDFLSLSVSRLLSLAHYIASVVGRTSVADDGGREKTLGDSSIVAAAAAGPAEDNETWAYERVCQLIQALPKSYDIEKVRKTFQINITPTGVVLMQELDRFNQLVSVVECDLIDLRNVRITDDAPFVLCPRSGGGHYTRGDCVNWAGRL